MGLDSVELVMMMEEEFGISISTAEAAEADTVGKMVDFVYSRLEERDRESGLATDGAKWTKKRVFFKVRDIAVTVLGVEPEEIKPESHWVKDLGLC